MIERQKQNTKVQCNQTIILTVVSIRYHYEQSYKKIFNKWFRYNTTMTQRVKDKMSSFITIINNIFVI